jgi:hypothetical protein
MKDEGDRGRKCEKSKKMKDKNITFKVKYIQGAKNNATRTSEG